MIKNLVKWIEKCSAFGGYISGLFMVLIVILIFVEIVARSIFNVSTLIADEYSAYFFVAVVMMGLSFSMKEEAHIRITIIMGRLGKGPARILDLVTHLAAIILTSYALYHAVMMVYDTWDLEMTADSISETPIYLPQIVIPVGLLLFILQLVAQFIRRLSSYQTR